MNSVVVKKGIYRDSITLLRVSKGVAAVKGVRGAAVVMATPLNKRVLSDMGFSEAEVKKAGTDDMVVAIDADGNASLSAALEEAERLLSAKEEGASAASGYASLGEAAGSTPGANLAVISVPGTYAKHEGIEALNSGLNVFMFSSNVSREDERELKELALRKGLLMMGPDCGTAIINQVVLGFGNAVREGSVGLVSASGTGLQEVSCLIHRAGFGVSQAVGTGGGDLSDKVGGLMTIRSLELLEHDDKTKVIVLLSKPPGPKTARLVMAALGRVSKPVVVDFLGADQLVPRKRNLLGVKTLDEAAAAACKFAGGKAVAKQIDFSEVAASEASRLAASQRYVRGLFAGGTLCYEAQLVLSPIVGPMHSNAPLDKRFRVDGTARSEGHACIDMGDEEFVVGRAHPMIDFTLRKMRILEEAKDVETAVLLLDVELGLGSNPDPAGELAPTIAAAKAKAAAAGRYLPVIASIVGTDGDFQGFSNQERVLKKAGVLLTPSSGSAATLAGLIVKAANAKSSKRSLK